VGPCFQVYSTRPACPRSYLKKVEGLRETEIFCDQLSAAMLTFEAISLGSLARMGRVCEHQATVL